MAFTETAEPRVASMASQGLVDPASLSHDEIRAVCASALTKVPDHRKDEVTRARSYDEQIAIALATIRFGDLPDDNDAR